MVSLWQMALVPEKAPPYCLMHGRLIKMVWKYSGSPQKVVTNYVCLASCVIFQVNGNWYGLPFMTIDGLISARSEGHYQVLETGESISFINSWDAGKVPCKHAGMDQYRASTGPMLAAP